MKKMVGVFLVGTMLLAGCQGEWSATGGGNHKTSQLQVLNSPDPNGGVGLKFKSDSSIPQETEVNVAVGPVVTFYLGDVVGSAVDTVIPGTWNPIADVPAKLYGTMALLYETEQETFMFEPGTEIHLMPDWQIHPVVSFNYRFTEGGSITEDGFETIFGASYRFK